MARRCLSVHEVHDKMRRWTVLVQVVEKSHVLTSNGSPPIRFQRLVLTDSEGTMVSAVIYGNDIRYFANLLQPFKRYYITGGTVKKQDAKYKVSDYQFSWVLHNKTLVEEYVEPNPPMLPCTFEFTKFEDLFRFADTENVQNLQAVVVTAFATKEQNNGCTTRDFIVVNEEKKPMLLTLWNEFEQNQGTQLANSIGNANVIIGMKLKITTFNYLSLTTKPGSGLLINPPSSEANALKEWYNANKEEIAELIQQMAYKDSSKLLPPPSADDIISVANAFNTLKDVKTAWITGKISLSPGQQKFWFEACENCQKAINVDVGWVMRCPSCKEESKVVARTRVGIAVDDGTGSINTVIFGPDAEKLIPFTALQLWEAHTEELNFSAELSSAIRKHAIVCFIRYYESDYQGQKEGKYNIVKAYTTEESVHIPMAITTAETNEKIPDIHATVLQPTTKNEFFSPSTKKVLDTIAESSAAANEVLPTVTTAKRALVFGTVPPGFGLNSAEANTPTSLSTNAPGSPLKRQRDNEL
ncbi:replication protein A 70 kDa DNA-binding subunit B-like isoform X1 [Coffea eugenioides]|uniref:replication protein A 70 kDa DNA-binding subunit B-like isoform X1 n=1 Tax=Coffea eugenioides TaxID=49369 RepID=UPI000F6144E3|nr:replication protein A 70 kDa DNA-binding subunit B-like isoform X1 [Coffea eugenioides]XP_027168909.1 replication protein A 70 kDa DNA-binding subunit B-like isoform X1 [Coffea eugenioides]